MDAVRAGVKSDVGSMLFGCGVFPCTYFTARGRYRPPRGMLGEGCVAWCYITLWTGRNPWKWPPDGNAWCCRPRFK